MTNTFVSAANNIWNRTFTENGMPTNRTSWNACLDFFFHAGACRKTPEKAVDLFRAAYAEESELALRILLWLRDCRGGAGERNSFREIIKANILTPADKVRVMNVTPIFGRWDDVLAFGQDGYPLIFLGLTDQDTSGLCAKWMPRQGPDARKLAAWGEMSPKEWRKALVARTKVVETQMCNNDWDGIEYEKVPSLALTRYTKAFTRHNSASWNTFKNRLKTGEVEAKATTVYPYDLVNAVSNGGDDAVLTAQWKALPNYLGGKNVLPIVDTSGSMLETYARVSPTITARDIAVSLGLYAATKNTGPFAGLFLTFSESPTFQRVQLHDSLQNACKQIVHAAWNMNTNLEKAFRAILDLALQYNVRFEDMPETLVILSDMQFDACTTSDHAALEMIRSLYQSYGYVAPNVVFWNINSGNGTPATINDKGVALVSGFSPTLFKNVLAGDLTPMGVLWDTVGGDRYKI